MLLLMLLSLLLLVLLLLLLLLLLHHGKLVMLPLHQDAVIDVCPKHRWTEVAR